MKWWITISILFHLIIFAIPLPSTKNREKIMVNPIKMTYRLKKIQRQELLERKIRKEEIVTISPPLKKISSQKDVSQKKIFPIQFFSSELLEEEKPSFKITSLISSSKIQGFSNPYTYIPYKKTKPKKLPLFPPSSFYQKGRSSQIEPTQSKRALPYFKEEKQQGLSSFSLPSSKKIVYSSKKIVLNREKPIFSYRKQINLIKDSHLPKKFLIPPSLKKHLQLKNTAISLKSLIDHYSLNIQIDTPIPSFSFQKNTSILTFSKSYQLRKISFFPIKRETTPYSHQLRVSKKLFNLKKRLFYKTPIKILRDGEKQHLLSFKNQQIKKISTKKKAPISLIKEKNFTRREKGIVGIKVKREEFIFPPCRGLIISRSMPGIQSTKVKEKTLILPPRKSSIISVSGLLERKEFYQKKATPILSLRKVPLPPKEEEEKIFSPLPSLFTLVNLSKKVKSISPLLLKNKNKPIYSLPKLALVNTNYSNLIKSYLKRIVEIINKNKKYPSFARQRGEEGKVEVSFKLLKNGRVEDIKIISPSRYTELNKATEKLIYNLSPFPPFPPGINKDAINIKMEVIYELKEEH